MLKLARDTTLWKIKCFETAPSAARLRDHRPRVRLSSSDSSQSFHRTPSTVTRTDTNGVDAPSPNRRTRHIAEWDLSDRSECVDWYNEFIARNAPLSVAWNDREDSSADEICGVALHGDSERAVTCQNDGSVAIWDIREQDIGGRKFRTIAKGRPDALFSVPSAAAGSSKRTTTTGFSGVTDCVTLDSSRQRAYIAVDQTLNEVDLTTLEVVSQQQYAWRITALSRHGMNEPLSVGTSWSLHLYDPRVQARDRSRSPEDLMRTTPGKPEDSIAFLPNYDKQTSIKPRRPVSLVESGVEFRSDLNPHPWSPRWSNRHRFARVEPGPLAILHRQDNEILVAGRFPSILAYDRRFFPKLQYSIHSGARLAALATIPYAPKGAPNDTSAHSTLVACGEYGGRGSLELYALPHASASLQGPSTGIASHAGFESALSEIELTDCEPTETDTEPSSTSYSYKNRQQASSAKLLSLATQGTRLVVSDAEGSIKWFERDGRGLARRFELGSPKDIHRSDLVARKILPLSPDNQAESEQASANSDLLIWTGENLGIVTTRPKYENHEEMAKSLDSSTDEEWDDERKTEEYGKAMRQALERQADERRWMSRFNFRRR